MTGILKVCKKCGVEKLLEAFRPGRHGCKTCAYRDRDLKKAQESFRRWSRNNPDKVKARWEKWKRKNPEGYRQAKKRDYEKNYRLREYGLTQEGYQLLLLEQGNACACCKETFTKTPHVDHLHGSSPCFVRGLLCGPCNKVLGMMKDSPMRLENAAAYLKKFLP